MTGITCEVCGKHWTNEELEKILESGTSLRAPQLPKQVMIKCSCGQSDIVFERRVISDTKQP